MPTDHAASIFSTVPTSSPISDLRVILSSVERRGVWTVPRHLDVRALLGTIELDLRHARFAPGVTTIDVSVVLGSVTITLPNDLLVEVGMTAALGSVDESTGFAVPDEDRAVLRIVGYATLGSCEIVRAG